MLKILQARSQQYMNRELPDVPARFRKGRGTRDQIANIYWIIEKAREFQKHIFSSVQFSRSVVSDSLQPHESKHARLPCPSPTPRFHPNTSTSALLTMPKPLTMWTTTNRGKFFKRWECQTTWPVSWEICMQVKKQQLGLDMEQQTGSKYGKEYIKAVYCHPAYLTYMQSTSCEMPDCIKPKLESRLPREIWITFVTKFQ